MDCVGLGMTTDEIKLPGLSEEGSLGQPRVGSPPCSAGSPCLALGCLLPRPDLQKFFWTTLEIEAIDWDYFILFIYLLLHVLRYFCTVNYEHCYYCLILWYALRQDAKVAPLRQE